MTAHALAFRIGGYDIRVTGAEAAALLGGAPDFAPFRITEPCRPEPDAAESVKAAGPAEIPANGGARPLFTLRTECDLPADEGETLYTFSFDGIGCRFGRTQPETGPTSAVPVPPGYFLTMTPPRGDAFSLRFRPGDPLVRAAAPGSAAMLRFGLWTAYGLAGVFRKAVPVHASVVVWHGSAVLFLGESGTGKSTHTRLWQRHIPGAALLNDDSPILRVEEGIPYVYGSPWSGKNPCFRNERYPLAAAVRLCQAPHNRIEPLPTIHAFGALFPSCPPAFARDPLLSDRLCGILSDTIRHIRSYRLECLPDRNAAETAFAAIFGTDKTAVR